MPASQPDPAELQRPVDGERGRESASGFDRRRRLLKPDEFKRVFSRACRVGSSHLTMLALSNRLGHPRLGMAISKKNVKRAVKRNLIKRQLRESFRRHQAIIGGFDVVVLAKPGSDRLAKQQLRDEIDSCWRKITTKCAPS